MGKRVEWDYGWMQNMNALLSVNVRLGSEHTVEYLDKEHNLCVVRIPVALVSFLERVENLKLKPKQRRAA